MSWKAQNITLSTFASPFLSFLCQFLGLFKLFLATNQVHKSFNRGMSVNMIHCCLQCSWVKDEQRPCIIQSDTVLWHTGQGNWSQSFPQGRADQLPCETEAEAHRGIAINTRHDLNSFTTKWQFMWQGQSLNFLLQPIKLLPFTTLHKQLWKYDAVDQQCITHKTPHGPVRHRLLTWTPKGAWWEISIPLTQTDSFFCLGLI